MHKHMVSIIMPVKNAAPYLSECIDSILEQSLTNWQLLAVNDHSNDDSLKIIKKYEALDKRINVLMAEGVGVISALQTGYRYSGGTYITRMDADDIMHPDKLKFMMKALASKGQGFVAVGEVTYFNVNGLGAGYASYAKWLNSLTAKGLNFSEIYKECPIPSPSWLMHRLDFDKCGAFSSGAYPEDYDLAFRMREVGLQIAPVKEKIHFWRDYPTRTSRTDVHYKDNRFLELKIKWFLNSDCNSKYSLVLWGAGAKGKVVAKIFNNNEISFIWMSNNLAKIGKEIYGTTLQSIDRLQSFSASQVLVAICSPKEEEAIQLLIHACPQHEFFRLC